MKIVFLDSATLSAASLAPIEKLGDLVCYSTSSPEEAQERVKDADILIVNKIRVSGELIDAAPQLKLICEAATGVNNIDLDAAGRRGIPVRNVAGYSTDSVAQLSFAMALSLVCDLRRFDGFVKDGSYSRSPIFTDVSRPYLELCGKTMGIIGLGTIGTKVAHIASAFGMRVIYYSASGKDRSSEYERKGLEELLAGSDIVSIHCPLTEKTRGLIGSRELGMMKRSAVIINAARGGIIDEQALSDAVGAGTIAGAGVDVFTREPIPSDNPLLHCARPDHLVLTPHVAWASREAQVRLVEGIAGNIREYLEAAH